MLPPIRRQYQTGEGISECENITKIRLNAINTIPVNRPTISWCERGILDIDGSKIAVFNKNPINPIDKAIPIYAILPPLGINLRFFIKLLLTGTSIA